MIMTAISVLLKKLKGYSYKTDLQSVTKPFPSTKDCSPSQRPMTKKDAEDHVSKKLRNVC